MDVGEETPLVRPLIVCQRAREREREREVSLNEGGGEAARNVD